MYFLCSFQFGSQVKTAETRANIKSIDFATWKASCSLITGGILTAAATGSGENVRSDLASSATAEEGGASVEVGLRSDVSEERLNPTSRKTGILIWWQDERTLVN